MSTAEQDVTAWPLEDIAAILGGELQLVRPGIWQIDVPSKPLGTSLALRLSPDYGAVQLEPERDKRAGPWTIGSITYYGVCAVEVASTTRAVIFRTNDRPPQELTVTHLGQFQLVSGIAAGKVKPITAAGSDEEQVTIVGRLARPLYAEGKKTPFWQAGLAEQLDGAEQPIWHNVKCWGSLAHLAHQFTRGQRVKVTGVRRLEKWRKDGVTHVGSSVLLTAIEAA